MTDNGPWADDGWAIQLIKEDIKENPERWKPLENALIEFLEAAVKALNDYCKCVKNGGDEK